MNFPFYIAGRYVKAKKSHNAINIITLISIIAVLLSSAAFIIVLSVFNGFDSLVSEMYSDFYSDIQITPEKGKVFSPDSIPFQQLKNIKGIKNYATALEDDALAIYDDKQWYVTVRGVDDNYTKVSGIDSSMYEGEYNLNTTGPRAVVGRGVAMYLGIGLDFAENLKLVVPKKTPRISFDPNKALNQKYIRAIGKFTVQPEIDNKYIFVPLSYAQNLFDYTNQVSSIEIRINATDEKSILQALETIFPNGYLIRNTQQQNQLLYKTMQSEKWAIFLILTFILVIASFNLIGSITMLIIEKKNDIIMLRNLGTTKKQTQRIFFFEGLLITSIGLFTGLTLGLGICFLQLKFGLLKLQGMFVIDAYPVKVEFTDVLLVIAIVLSIGLFSSYYPVKKVIKKHYL